MCSVSVKKGNKLT